MDTIRPIHTKADHKAALAEIERLWDAKPGSREFDKLDILGTLVDAYERAHTPILPPDPVEVSTNTMTLRATIVLVTTGPAPAARCRARWAAGGRAARTHSKQWEPTVASRRQSGQAGRPHRVQARPVGRSR